MRPNETVPPRPRRGTSPPGVTPSGILDPLEATRQNVERDMLRGERFTDVEDAIDSSDLSADEKAALWLLAWSYVHPRAQRSEANAHLGSAGRRDTSADDELARSSADRPVRQPPSSSRRSGLRRDELDDVVHPEQQPATTSSPASPRATPMTSGRSATTTTTAARSPSARPSGCTGTARAGASCPARTPAPATTRCSA